MLSTRKGRRIVLGVLVLAMLPLVVAAMRFEPKPTRVVMPYVGVQVIPVSPVGVKVIEVALDSPAHSAGLQPGDHLLSIDGKYIDVDALTTMLAQHHPYDILTINMLREGERHDLTLTLQPSPTLDSANEALMNLDSLRDGVTLTGISYNADHWVITQPDDVLQQMGLQAEDRIVGMNGYPLDAYALAKLRTTMLFASTAMLHVQRDHDTHLIRVPAAVAQMLLVNEASRPH